MEITQVSQEKTVKHSSLLQFPVLFDGIAVDFECLLGKAKDHQNIWLIRFLKSVSTLSLLNAKNAIYDCQMQNGVYDSDKIKKTFGKYIRMPQALSTEDRQNNLIINGIRCALKHYKTLGFNSKYDACNMVLGNILSLPAVG